MLCESSFAIVKLKEKGPLLGGGIGQRNSYRLKTPHVPSVAPCHGRDISFERFPGQEKGPLYSILTITHFYYRDPMHRQTAEIPRHGMHQEQGRDTLPWRRQNQGR